VPQQPFRGQGSGFIISADGLILTNAHVVRDAKEVTVKLSDRSEYPAKVLGSDPVTDVAVLRIDAKNLPTVRLGNPKELRVGDPVLAIGAPFGFEQTATQGIVSAKGRSLPGDAVVPFIQTDAAVNPGNSGGPLFSGNGEVIGINAQIYSHTGGYQGLAFAIPIDVALKVKDQIVATGKASHGRLGVTVQDLTAPLAESFGLEATRRRAGVAGRAGQRRRRRRPEGGRRHHPRQRRGAGALGRAEQRDRHVRAGREGPLERVARPEGDRHRGQAGRRGTPADEAVADAGDAAQGPRLGLSLRPLQPQEKSRPSSKAAWWSSR
jgi:serine protease Do